jgi:hypothetical protein
MTLHLTATQCLAGLGVVVTLLTVWRVSARRERAAADAARVGARLLSLAGRVVVTAGVIVGVQWLVITYPIANRWVLLAVLTLPALFASYTLTRALTVTTVDVPQTRRGRRGGRR